MTDSQLRSFLPVRLIRALEEGGGTELELDAALVFADISGFTTLAARLVARSGTGGADALSRIINTSLGILLPVIEAEGGEVAAFAGDGILSVFRGPCAVDDAMRCASRLAEVAQGLPSAEDIRLGLKTAVTFGRLRVVRVGGDQDEWCVLLSGPAVAQVGATFAAARPGHAAISGEALAEVELGSFSTAAAAGRSSPSGADPAAEEVSLSSWLPGLVRAQQDLSLDGWSAELRALTIVFMNLQIADPAAASAEMLARVVRVCQEELRQHGGHFDAVAVDEKGVMLTGAFGLGGRRTERMADAAVRAALVIRERVGAMGLTLSLGVATGRVFVGPVGTPWRRELALLGAPMIMAARLCFLGLAGVVVDETTRALASDLVTEPLPTTPLKGFAEPVPRHLVTKALRRSLTSGRTDPIIGRDAELAILDDALTTLEGGESAVLTLEGAPGIGKSRLCAHLVERARAAGVPVLEILADADGRDRPWNAVRPAMEAAMGIPPTASAAVRQAAVEAAATRIGRAGLAPLLASSVGLQLPDTPESARVSGGGRAEASTRLVGDILAPALEGPAAVLLVDDAQWADPGSAAALVGLQARLGPTLVVLAVRVGPDAPPPALQALSGRGRVLSIPELEPDAVGHLLEARLGKGRVSEEVQARVAERAGGNPFFICELAATLVARAGEADPEELDTLLATPTVDSAIARRLDVLPQPAQLAAKAASVLGMRFPESTLGAIHPLGGAAATSGLAALAQAGMIERNSQGEARFNHRITRDVIYAALLKDQRRQLHAAAARAMASEPARSHSRLAHHHERAGDLEPALAALGSAWAAADRAGAFQESRALAHRALSICDRLPPDALRRATWWRRLSEHAAHLGQFPMALEESRHALEALEVPLPEGARAWRRRLAQEIGRQLWHRIAGRLPAGPVADVRAHELTHAHVRAAEGLTFARGDRVYALTTFLASINLAERAGIPGVAANAWGVVGVALTALGLHRAGAFYVATALRTARAAGDGRLVATAEFHEATALAVRGRWAESEATYVRCAAGCEASGNHFLINFVWAAALLNTFTRGALGEVDAAAVRLERVAERTGQARGGAVAAYVRGFAALYAGDPETAEARCRVARDTLRQIDDVSWTNAAAGLAQALMRLGRVDEAIAEAEQILDVLRGARPPDSRRLEAFAGPAEVLLAAAFAGRPHPRLGEALTLVHQSARTFGVGRARAALMDGLAARLRGDRSGAIRHLQAAVQHAEAWDLQLELVRARLALTAARGSDHPDARTWLREAHITHLLDAPELRPWTPT